MSVVYFILLTIYCRCDCIIKVCFSVACFWVQSHCMIPRISVYYRTRQIKALWIDLVDINWNKFITYTHTCGVCVLPWYQDICKWVTVIKAVSLISNILQELVWPWENITFVGNRYGLVTRKTSNQRIWLKNCLIHAR